MPILLWLLTFFASFAFAGALAETPAETSLHADSCRVLYDPNAGHAIRQVIKDIQDSGVTTKRIETTQAVAFNDYFLKMSGPSTLSLEAYLRPNSFAPMWKGSAENFKAGVKDLSCEKLHAQAKRSYENLAIAPQFRNRLTYFANTRRLQPKLGELILQHEALNSANWWEFPSRIQSLHDRYQTLLGQAKAAWDTDGSGGLLERLDRLRHVLFEKTQFYCLKNARMSDLLENECGNCEAQTLLYTAILLDLNFSLPAQTFFAIQHFADHVRPIIYIKGETATIIDLVSGDVESDIRGDIYSPEIISYAYLAEKGAAQSRERDSLRYAFTDFLNMNFQLGFSSFFGFQPSGPRPKGPTTTYLDFGPAVSAYNQEEPSESSQSEFQPIQISQDTLKVGTSAPPSQGNTSDTESSHQAASPEPAAADMDFEFNRDDMALGSYRGGNLFLRSPLARQQRPGEKIEFLDGVDFTFEASEHETIVQDEYVGGRLTAIINPGHNIIFRYGSELANQWQNKPLAEDRYYLLKDHIDKRLYTLMKSRDFARLTEIYNDFYQAKFVFENERQRIFKLQQQLRQLFELGEKNIASVFRLAFELDKRESFFNAMIAEHKLHPSWKEKTQAYKRYELYTHVAFDVLADNYWTGFSKLEQQQSEKVLLEMSEADRQRFFRFFAGSTSYLPYAYIFKDQIGYTYPVQSRLSAHMKDRLRSPLVPLFEKLMMTGEYGIDFSKYVPVKNEQMILVEVETGGTWQALPKIPMKAPVETSMDGLKEEPVKAEERSRPSYNDKILSRDIVTGLFLTLNEHYLRLPLVQMKAFQIWDEEMQKTAEAQFTNVGFVGFSYLYLWSWTPLLTSKFIRENGRSHPVFALANSMGIDFLSDYEKLILSGKARQLHIKSDSRLNAYLPDFYQAVPPYVAASLENILKHSGVLQVSSVPYVDRDDRSRIFQTAPREPYAPPQDRRQLIKFNETVLKIKVQGRDELHSSWTLTWGSGAPAQALSDAVYVAIDRGAITFSVDSMAKTNNYYRIDLF